VSKPCQDQFLHPILVHSIIEKKENTGSQMGHTKKIILKKFIGPEYEGNSLLLEKLNYKHEILHNHIVQYHVHRHLYQGSQDW